MARPDRLLLDRALLLSALIDREDGRDERLLTAVTAPYDALLYEGAGASGIEGALRKRADLASRLVVIAEDAADVDIQERELLRATLTVALTDATVLRALQSYQTQALAHRRDRAEILGYAFRLLLLARRLRADLLPWPPRAPLVLALLEAAGVRGSTAPADAGMVVFQSEPCVFPYLPPRPSPPSAQPLWLLVAPEHVSERMRGQIRPHSGSSGADHARSRSIFVSYSHRDRRWLDKLSTMLRPLARDGSLELWSDELIRPGADWRDDIRAAIERSAVAVPARVGQLPRFGLHRGARACALAGDR